MGPKDYIALAELTQKNLINRRSYEWKINFGLWSSIGLWTYFCLSNPLVLAGLSISIVAHAYIVIVIIYIGFWQLSIRQGMEHNKQWKKFYMHSAEGLKPERPSPKFSDIFKWHQLSYTLSQSLFTIALLLGSFFLLLFAQPGVGAIKHSSSYTITLPDSTYQVVITHYK